MGTEVIRTVQASGGDYATVSGWLAGEQTDLTTALVFTHGGLTGTIVDGDPVKGATSTATGTVVGIVSSTQIIIEAITGTFQSGEQIDKTSGGVPTGTDYVTSSNAGDSPISVAEFAAETFNVGSGIDVSASFTVSSTAYVILRAQAGAEHNGVRSAGPIIMSSGTNYTTAITLPYYSIVDDLEVIADGIGGKGSRPNCYPVGGMIYATFNRCIFEGYALVNNGASSGNVFNACWADNFDTFGFWGGNYKSPRPVFNSCTASNCSSSGFRSHNNTPSIFTNCVGFNNVADFSSGGGGYGTSDYNASEDTTAPGANSITSITSAAFTNAATNDYSLSGTGSVLYHAGVTISGLTLDITNRSYDVSTPSIGAYEYLAGGATSTGSGTPQANTATASGAGDRIIPGSGSPQAATATVSGAGDRIIVGSTAVQALTASSTGVGERIITGSGAVQANVATGQGTDAQAVVINPQGLRFPLHRSLDDTLH